MKSAHLLHIALVARRKKPVACFCLGAGITEPVGKWVGIDIFSVLGSWRWFHGKINTKIFVEKKEKSFLTGSI